MKVPTYASHIKAGEILRIGDWELSWNRAGYYEVTQIKISQNKVEKLSGAPVYKFGNLQKAFERLRREGKGE